MRIARLLLRSSARPHVALERDGFYYDIGELERIACASESLRDGAPRPLQIATSSVDASDFHTRVVSMACAGLAELDTLLLRGFRPEEACLDAAELAPLAPCDTQRATYVHVDPRAAGVWPVRAGLARTLAGQDAVIGVPVDSIDRAQIDFEVGVAALLGEDVSRATVAEAKHAIVGWMVLVEICMLDVERLATCHLSSPRGTRVQVGPWLTPAQSISRLADARVEVSIAGGSLAEPTFASQRHGSGAGSAGGSLAEPTFASQRHGSGAGSAGGRIELGYVRDLGFPLEEAVSRASHIVPLGAGDLVGIGPLPRATGRAAGVALRLHDRLEVTIEKLGTLRAVVVPELAARPWV